MIDRDRIHAAYPDRQSVIDYLAAHGRDGNRVRCPNPTHDDTHPSASVFVGREGRPLIRCHSCGWKGSIVEAMRALGDHLLVRPAPPPPVDHHFGPADYQYWGGRGIRPETVDALGLTWGATGHTGRHVVPYRDAEGNTRTLRSRAAHTSTGPRWYTPAAQPAELWWAPNAHTADVIVLTEGESDAIAAYDCGWASVACPGADAWQPQWATQFTGRWVMVCGDGDEAGRRYAIRVYEDLVAAGAKAYAPIVPDSTDLAELHQRQALAQWLADTLEGWPTGWAHLTEINDDTDLGGETWLVQNIIPAEGITLVAGRSGVGKSLLLEDLCVAVASQRKWWLGGEIKTSGPVVILDWENPKGTIVERRRLVGADHTDIHWFVPDGTLADHIFVREVADMLAELRPVAVFIDSFTQAFPGLETQKDSAVVPAMNTIRRLCGDIDATCLLLHHANKSNFGGMYEKVSGSFQFQAQSQASWLVEVRGERNYLLPTKIRQGPKRAGIEWAVETDTFFPDRLQIKRLGCAPPIEQLERFQRGDQ